MEKDSSKISMKQKEGSSSRRRMPILVSERHKSRQQQQVLSTPVSTTKEIVSLQIQPSPPKLKRKMYSSGNEQEENSLMSSSFLLSSERLNLPSFDEIFGNSSSLLPLNLRPRKCSSFESKDLSGLFPHEFSDLDSDDDESTFDRQSRDNDGAGNSSTAASIRFSAFERPRTRRRWATYLFSAEEATHCCFYENRIFAFLIGVTILLLHKGDTLPTRSSFWNLEKRDKKIHVYMLYKFHIFIFIYIFRVLLIFKMM